MPKFELPKLPNLNIREKAEKLAKELTKEVKEAKDELVDKAQRLLFKNFKDQLIIQYKTNTSLFKSKTLTEVKNKELLTNRKYIINRR